MARNSFKRRKNHGGKHFVLLPEWVLSTDAWRSLSVGARALYVELKRRYKGGNNGNIRLSHREAAERLGLHRNSVGKLFRELEEKGFIQPTATHCLGPSGIGQTSSWALDEYANDFDKQRALKRFVGWKKIQKPRTKHVPSRHKDCDAQAEFVQP